MASLDPCDATRPLQQWSIEETATWARENFSSEVATAFLGEKFVLPDHRYSEF